MYIAFVLITFGISFISSSFVLIEECDLGCNKYFLPLSFPLGLSVYISPLFIYPPIMEWSLNLFGFDLLTINGQFIIELNTNTWFITNLATLSFTGIIFSINFGFTLIFIMILYYLGKRKITKGKISPQSMNI